MEEYVRWLVKLYQARFGPLPDPDVVEKGVRILRRCLNGLPGADEFASLVAAEVAERLDGTSRPFLDLLGTAADTVRKRIVRHAQKWHTNTADGALGQLPTPPPADEAAVARIKAELLECLSFEEQLIAEMMIAGEPVASAAARLGVSSGTVYRRLKDIQKRLGYGQDVNATAD